MEALFICVGIMIVVIAVVRTLIKNQYPWVGIYGLVLDSTRTPPYRVFVERRQDSVLVGIKVDRRVGKFTWDQYISANSGLISWSHTSKKLYTGQFHKYDAEELGKCVSKAKSYTDMWNKEYKEQGRLYKDAKKMIER